MVADLMEVDSHAEMGQEDVKYAEERNVNEIVAVLREVAKTSLTLDPYFVWKGLKELGNLRAHHLNEETLLALINLLYPDSSVFKMSLLKAVNGERKCSVPNAQEIRAGYPASFYEVVSDKTIEVAPEINSFIHLLVVRYLFDAKKLQELEAFNKKVILPKVLAFYNQRSTDLISAKLWFYVVLCDEARRERANLETRSTMIKSLKIASLRHNSETKAMLITLLLRSFLATGEVETAADFMAKVEFPNSADVSSPLEARFYYYLSKINAIQLDYSTANEYIIAAIRKAPNTPNSLGFLQQANKLHCVIELLMGGIPELSFFHQAGMQRSLQPYYDLSKAVKLGDLKKFTSAIAKYKPQLIKDGNYQLYVRLRSNVIKTGIRIISLTYKKISLRDICLKLRLDSEQTGEYMVSRAIRDGVIEAKINHEQGYIETSELLNVYDTKEPQDVFDERIQFVNQLHDESVVAMRYPEDNKGKNNTNEEDDFIDGELLDDLSDFSDIDGLGFL